MKKRKLIAGNLLTIALVTSVQIPVSAMPADIQEAVSSPDYNAYEHSGSYAGYDDSETG